MAKTLSKLISPKISRDRFHAVWVWNLKLEHEEIIKQLTQFKEKGFNTVIIKPTKELEPAYLSEDFFEFLNYTLKHASKLSLSVRISESIAGGAMSIASSIADKNKNLRLLNIKHIEEVNLRNSRTFSRDISNPESWFGFAVRIRNNEIEQSSAKNLESKIEHGHINWKATHGEWIVSSFSRQFQYLPLSGYQIDFFNPKAVTKYCSMLYETFKTNIEQKYWHKSFLGFVFELPHIGPAAKEIIWSESMQAKFKTKFKQNFAKVLPLLFHHGGKRTGMMRYNVYTFMQKLFDDVFLSQIIKAENKYKLNNEYYAWSTNPYYPDDSLEILPLAETAKKLNGVFSLSGKGNSRSAASRLICRNTRTGNRPFRTFIGRNSTSTSATLQSLRFEIDKQIIDGCRNWIFDGLAYSPSHKSHPFTPNNPFLYSSSWEYISRLINYARTISRLTEDAAVAQRKILLVYPRASLYAVYSPTNQTEYNKSQAVFAECEDICNKLNIEYDIIEEEELLNTSFGSNKIKPKSREGFQQYDLIIMPRITLISKKTIPLIKKALEKNVSVLWVGCLPMETIEDGLVLNIRKQLEELRKKYSSIAKLFESAFMAEEYLRNYCKPLIKASTSKSLTEDICTTCFNGKNTFFLILNKSETIAKNIDVTINTNDKLYLADCDKEELYRFPKARQIDKGYEFNLDIQPRQMYMLIAAKKGLSTARGHLFEGLAGLERKYRIVFKNKWNFKPDGLNMLPLTFWNMRISGSRENSGFFRFFETYIEAEELPKTIKLMLNGIVNTPTDKNSPFYKHVEISVNGIKLKDFQLQSPYGESFWTPQVPSNRNTALGKNVLETDITNMVHKGFNRISIRSLESYYSPQFVNYPPYIAGDFALKRGGRGWILCNENTVQEYASWTDGGYPYYSGSGTYSQTFERPDAFKRLVIKFKKVEEIAIVTINGQLVATFPYEPMEVDVTHLTLQGKNEISIQVLNTIDNVTKLNSRPSGLLGEVFLDVY